MFDTNIAKLELKGAITHFQEDIGSLRTGRISPSIVENVLVEAYESKLPLAQVASISSPDPRTIFIQPWDKALMKAIETALQKSDLNLQPVVDKDNVRLSFPALTEENRKDLIKVLHQKEEQARISLKQRREKIKDKILGLEKDGDLTEDEKFKALEDLDREVKTANDQLKIITQAKEKEIMTI